MTEKAKNVVADDAEIGDTLADNLESELGEQLDGLEELVREHPLATLGIAAAAGFILALLLSRR